MAFDLISRRPLFPAISLPDFWDDDDSWLSTPANTGGLSVSEDDGKVYVEAAVPGIDPNNVEVTFQDGYLWVRGESKEEEQEKKKKYYKKAVRSFSYRVAIPTDVDNNQEPEASYKHGIMTVVFSKAPKSQPKKISVKKISE